MEKDNTGQQKLGSAAQQGQQKDQAQAINAKTKTKGVDAIKGVDNAKAADNAKGAEVAKAPEKRSEG